MRMSRRVVALIAGLAAAFAVFAPLAWLINTRDWGVALMFAVPFAVYGLIRLGLRLSDWAGIG